MNALGIAALVALALVPAAAAHDAGPCGDSGKAGNSDYAQHKPVAQGGDAGAVDHDGDGMAHTPGAHQGYSACME